MNKEHIFVQSAKKIESCCRHIETVMGKDGYEVKVSKIAGGHVIQVHVAKIKSSKKVLAYAMLNLWTDGDDLKLQIDKNSVVPNDSKNINPFDVLWPADSMIGPLIMSIMDSPKQKELEEKLFLVSALFLTAS